MKKSEECHDMQGIRNEIDIIDKNIIDLLGARFEYVKSASKFKKNEESVKAPERFTAMLAQRRIWAEGNRLSAPLLANGLLAKRLNNILYRSYAKY